jgi:hypothetical protein
MNWFIWEKMFTYFYNKFRPVNHMHYVAPWITVLSQHTVFTILSGLQSHFCVIFHETKHHTQALGTLVDRGLSLATR